MGKLGKIGVTLILSLTLGVTLFTASAFAQRINSHSKSSTILSSTLVKEALVSPDPASQSVGTQQGDHQPTNYQPAPQENTTCNRQNNCQHATKCAHTFRSAWGWMFICQGW